MSFFTKINESNIIELQIANYNRNYPMLGTIKYFYNDNFNKEQIINIIKNRYQKDLLNYYNGEFSDDYTIIEQSLLNCSTETNIIAVLYATNGSEIEYRNKNIKNLYLKKLYEKKLDEKKLDENELYEKKLDVPLLCRNYHTLLININE